MASIPTDYQRLPGTGRRSRDLFSAAPVWSRLYLGKDHLLCVDTRRFSEDYKRFYYRDIQAFIIRPSERRNIWSGVFVALAVVALAVALVGFNIPDRPTIIIALCLIGLFLLLLGINLALGPTCVTYLCTAVQTEELPSLRRLRRARAMVDRLRTFIGDAQGQLTPEEFQLKASVLEQAPRAALSDQPAPPTITSLPVMVHDHGGVHLTLFWLLLADLPCTLANVLYKSGWTVALSALVLLATIITTILALVKQRNSDLPARLKTIPWIVLTCLAIFFMISTGYGTFLAIRDQTPKVELSPLEDPVAMALSVVSTTISVVLGILGLFGLKKFRTTIPPPPPITVAPPESISDKS